MKKANYPKDEADRRKKVAEEKLMGAAIETIERMRGRPVARSIAFRLVALYESVSGFQQTVKAMAVRDPQKTIAPPFTVEQTNFLIKTYKSIIEDLHSHLEKKDSYIKKFSPFEELDEPTINEVTKTLFIMGTNILQILGYMVRWA